MVANADPKRKNPRKYRIQIPRIAMADSAGEGSKTKKRKQSSPDSATDPFSGILTRRRSEIFVQRNRSGHVRSYSPHARKRNTKVQLPNWYRGNPRASDSEIFDNEIVQNSIKDLRSRRVFSPASITDECYSNGSSEILEDAGFQKPKLADVFCKSEVVENERSKLGVDSNFQCTETSEMDESCRGEKKSIGESEILGDIDDITEEWLQTTPPDVDVFCKSEVENSGKSTLEFENPSSRRVSDSSGACINMDKNDRPRHRSRMDGLVPCSRMKLVKSSNSFSYRRLLPFLMDIAKDNSAALEIRECVKVEKSLGEKPVPPVSVSLSHEIPVVTNTKPLSPRHPVGCLASYPPGKSGETIPLNDSSVLQDLNLVSLGQTNIESQLQYLPENNQRTIAADVDLEMLQFPVARASNQSAELCSGPLENNLNSELQGGDVFSNGDCFQTVPLDTDVTCKLEAEENGRSRMGFDPQIAEKHQLPEVKDEKELLVDSCQDEMKVNGDGVVVFSGNESVEKWVQTTPPDVDIFCKVEVKENVETTVEFDLQSRNHAMENPLSRRVSDNDGCVVKELSHHDMNKNDCPRTMSRMDGLTSCSQLKLFKAPNSFSYRRLLPFLIDIAKDNSSAVKIHQHENIKKPVGEKPDPAFLFSSSKETPIKGVSTELLHVGHQMDCLASTPPEIPRESPSSEIQHSNLGSTRQPSTEPPLQNLPERNFISTANDSMITTPTNSFSECLSQVQQVMPNSSSELFTCNTVDFIPKADRPAGLSISPQAKTVEQGVLHISSHPSIGIEEDCMSMKLHAEVKPLESPSFCQVSPNFGATFPPLKPVVGRTKGILKRNPRGCRGPCTCLNCSSFRLHAERAFEFSRNQLQDAEEVAISLMSEVNCLRNLLGKFADASKALDAFELNQVNEACTNALEVEEMAKTRLLQMNNDLNIHCRMTGLQRPRVSFANQVENCRMSNTNS